MLSTAFCASLGVRYPIVQAPMAGGWTTPELVAAVSNAGALGVLAAARLTSDQLRAAIRETRARTDRPFGANFLIARPDSAPGDATDVQRVLDRFREALDLPPWRAELSVPRSPVEEHLDIALGDRVPVVSFGMGDPGPLVEQAQRRGARVMAMVTTVEEARRVEERGVDVVIAQGADAGGHRSTFEVAADGEVPLVGTMALVPQVVDEVSVPVLAAGGIADGRGLCAALALGAGGAQLGTRFLLARESGAPPAYRQRLLAATETETVVTSALTGRPARALRNRVLEEYLRAGTAPLGWPYQGMAAQDLYGAAISRGDADWFPILAGQGLRMLRAEQPAADIVADLVREARIVLSRLGAPDDEVQSDRVIA